MEIIYRCDRSWLFAMALCTQNDPLHTFTHTIGPSLVRPHITARQTHSQSHRIGTDNGQENALRTWNRVWVIESCKKKQHFISIHRIDSVVVVGCGKYYSACLFLNYMIVSGFDWSFSFDAVRFRCRRQISPNVQLCMVFAMRPLS